MRGAALLAACLALSATGGAAVGAPCVGASYDTPLPGAVEVERMYADVPSPTYPGLWQEGRVAGYVYRIFSNLSATLADRGESPDWAIDLRCGGDPVTCTRNAIGPVPGRAVPVADEIAACLRGDPVDAGILSQPAPMMDGLPLAALPPNGAAMDSVAGLATAAALAAPPPAPQAPRPAPAPDDPDRPSAQGPLPGTPPVPAGGDAAAATVTGLPSAALPPDGAPMESGAGLATAAALATGAPAPPIRAPAPPLDEPDRPSAQEELSQTRPGEDVGGEAARPDARLGVSIQPAEACGLDGVPREGAPVLVLQRMLDNAGHEIGAIDGLMGPRTRMALDAELGPGSADMEIEAAITALDAALCDPE